VYDVDCNQVVHVRALRTGRLGAPPKRLTASPDPSVGNTLPATSTSGLAHRPHVSRGRRPTQPSGEQREAAILATAEALLARRPLHEICVDDLAQGAGVSRSTFYFYFPSKYAAVLTLFERMVAQMDSDMRIFAEEPPAHPARCWRAGIDALFEAFRRRQALLQAMAEAVTSRPEFGDVWSRFMQERIDQTASLIVAERERGAAPDGIPAVELAISLNRMNERTMIAALAEQPTPAQHRVVDTLSHIWLSSIYGNMRSTAPSQEQAGSNEA
jgi:TetR/AcrR family transcriptional regulator, ethionamide resistance regulator